MWDDSYTAVIEETINGFEVYIEPNPDQYNEGYVWSVSKDGEELDTGLVFSIDEAKNKLFEFLIYRSIPNLHYKFNE
jgi:hypothetical protein